MGTEINGAVIDADAHVLETERTWDFMEPSDVRYRPDLVTSKNPALQYWVIDGKIRGHRFRTFSERELAELSEQTGRNMVTLPEARQMDDVSLRLQHMDALGIEVQVLHNTMWIRQVTDRPEVEVALCKGWNRWMADVWKQGAGRLRWTCVVPVLCIEEAVKELRFAKEHGAVGVALKPIEGDRQIIDPYFYPLFEEASRLSLAIAIHIANGNPTLCDLFTSRHVPIQAALMPPFRLPTIASFYWLLCSEIPELFPKLCWGFIETSAQWVPWILHEVRVRYKAMGKEWPGNILKEMGIFITCENSDDLSYVLQYGAEDSLVIGTDYGHTDPSTDVNAIALFRSKSEISDTVKEKVLCHNPQTLFAL